MRAMPEDESNAHVRWEQLNDLVDQRLDAEESRALELHLAECAECAAKRDALMTLSLDAHALPADVTPPDDLWNDVMSTIEAHRSANPSETEQRFSSPHSTPTLPPSPPRSPRTSRSNALEHSASARLPGTTKAWLAAAAITLMALSSGLTALYLRRPLDSATALATNDNQQPVQEGTTLLPAAFVETERTYLASVAEVQSLLDAQRDVLAPATIETVDRALATIDAAIAEARAALLHDPANRAIAELLETNYRQKLDLLRRTAGLHQTS